MFICNCCIVSSGFESYDFPFSWAQSSSLSGKVGFSLASSESFFRCFLFFFFFLAFLSFFSFLGFLTSGSGGAWTKSTCCYSKRTVSIELERHVFIICSSVSIWSSLKLFFLYILIIIMSRLFKFSLSTCWIPYLGDSLKVSLIYRSLSKQTSNMWY